VTSCIQGADEEIFERDEEGIWSYGEGEAQAAFKKLCINSLIATVGEVPFVKVSSKHWHSQDDD
jgi:hypothetical protein